MKKQSSKKFIRVKKKKPEKQQFPSNSRHIPERLPRFSSTNIYIFSICFLCGMLLMIILFQEQGLEQAFHHLTLATAARKETTAQLQHWQIVAQKYPDYPVLYRQIAVLQAQLGDGEQARETIQTALHLDPNSQETKNLEEKLKK